MTIKTLIKLLATAGFTKEVVITTLDHEVFVVADAPFDKLELIGTAQDPIIADFDLPDFDVFTDEEGTLHVAIDTITFMELLEIKAQHEKVLHEAELTKAHQALIGLTAEDLMEVIPQAKLKDLARLMACTKKDRP